MLGLSQTPSQGTMLNSMPDLYSPEAHWNLILISWYHFTWVLSSENFWLTALELKAGRLPVHASTSLRGSKNVRLPRRSSRLELKVKFRIHWPNHQEMCASKFTWRGSMPQRKNVQILVRRSSTSGCIFQMWLPMTGRNKIMACSQIDMTPYSATN